MKKTIILCTILLLVAAVGVNAQTSNTKGTTDDKSMVTPKTSTVNRTNTNMTQTKAVNSKPIAQPTTRSSVSKSMPTSASSVGKKRPGVATSDIDMTKKLGAHAPEFSDPNYATKLEEWKKNYPEEYNAYLSTQTNTGNK